MIVPSDAELEVIAASYRGWLDWDAQHEPSAEAKKDLTKIETRARKFLESLEGAGDRARNAVALQIGEMLTNPGVLRTAELSVPPGRAVLRELEGLTTTVISAADRARNELPQWWRETAPRMAASELRALFLSHGLKFSATADEYGGISHAVAALLEIARVAGDVDMTADSARKWVEFAARETIDQKTGDGFPMS